MRFILCFLLMAGLGAGGWYYWQNNPQVHSLIEDKLRSSEFYTLEIRYPADVLMEKHKKELLKNEGYTFLEPKLHFSPYLLMDVKFAKDSTLTQEGFLLFGLNDGEMIIDGLSFEKTHGYEDCLLSKASKEDFKILRVLIENGGSLEREKIYQKFKVDSEQVDEWIESCRIKKLLVMHENKMRLHFEKPKFATYPITKLNETLVTYPAKNSQKVKQKYSSSQIKELALKAFGGDFAIRNMEEVFLPVYHIQVQNPDGSILTTSWNALTGKRME